MNNAINENDKIVAVLVYLDRKKTRSYVGKLTSENENGKVIFSFIYDAKYLKRRYAIPLGPDLPFSEKIYKAMDLFPSFKDRIPPRENPAYIDYCKEAGIPTQETNPIVLLSTIGKRGPSSFIFEPEYKEGFSSSDLKSYREMLGLTIREFASLFLISASHLQKIESGRFPGKDILRLIEIYKNHPAVALEEIKKNSKAVHSDKYRNILKTFGISLDQKKVSTELGAWSDILTFEEVKYTLMVVKKLKNVVWGKKVLENKKIKSALAAVQGYDLLIKKITDEPEIKDLDKRDIPMLMQSENGKLWVFGSDANGKPKLSQFYEKDCGIKFLDKPRKLYVPMDPKPEIYFLLNKKYHNHFNKEKFINIKSHFFEIRVAYSIHKENLEAEYEVKGKNKKLIDFKIKGRKTNKNFLVELTSLRDSDKIKQNTWKIEDTFGYSSPLSINEGMNPPEIMEYIRLQNAIFTKTKKFQKITSTSGNYNIIIVDMRGFQIGISDENDYYHLVYGGTNLDEVYKRHFTDKNEKKSIFRGIFEKSHPNQEALEKIHAIGFVFEKNFTENEIASKTKLYVNPHKTNIIESEILRKLFSKW